MVARARLISFIESFLSARRSADRDALARYLSDTVICHFAGERSLMPLAGHYEGRAAVLQFLQALEADFDCADYRLGDVVGSLKKLSVRWSATLINRGSRERLSTCGAAQIEFSNDRIDYFALFADTAGMARLMGWAPTLPDAALDPSLFRAHQPGAPGGRAEADAYFVSLQEGLQGDRCAEVVRRCFHPQARVRFAGAGIFPPFSGLHSGHAAIVSSVRRLHEEFERQHGHIHDILVEGNRASVHSRLRLRHRRTARTADVETCDMYVLDHEGGIVEWTTYCDTGLLAYLAKGGDTFT